MPAVFIPTNSQVPEISQSASFAAGVGLFYVVAGSAPVTATLPTAAGISGTVVRIRCANGYTGLCTVATTSGQTIGPGSTQTQIIYAGETALVQSDGANWVRTGGVVIPMTCQMQLRGADQTIAYGTDTVVTVNFVVIDNTGLMFDIAATRIKILRSGVYRVTSSAFFGALNGAQGHSLYLLTQQNGTTTLNVQQVGLGAPGTSFSYGLVTTGLTALNAGDTINAHVYQANSGGSGTASLTSTNGYTFLEVQELPAW